MVAESYFSTIEIAALSLAMVSIASMLMFWLLQMVKKNPRSEIGVSGNGDVRVSRLEELGLSKKQALLLNKQLNGNLDQPLVDLLSDVENRQLLINLLEEIQSPEETGDD